MNSIKVYVDGPRGIQRGWRNAPKVDYLGRWV